MAISGGHASEHLANERTFLAWIRTALSLIGLGFVLARMGLFLRQLAGTSLPGTHMRLHAGNEFVVCGVVFLLLGTTLCGWSSLRYQATRRAIDSGHFEPSKRSILVLSAIVVSGSLVIVVLVLWRTLGAGAV